MSTTIPNISDLVDITDTHGDMIPRAEIDYFRSEDSIAGSFGLTKDYHTKLTIKEYLGRGTRHFCHTKDVPSAAVNPPTLPEGYEWTQNPPEYRPPVHGDLYLYNNKAIIALGESHRYTNKEWIVRKITKAAIKLEVGKTYLTEDNYLVHIACVNTSTNKYFTTIACSPGVDGANLSINQFLKSSSCKRSYGFKKYGWAYESTGEICLGSLNEWTKKLKIVKELPFSLPPAPTGYQYAGGFPQFREPKKGERFLSAGTIKNGLPEKEYSTSNNIIFCNENMDTPRLILEKVETPAIPSTFEVKPDNYYLTEGGYIVKLDNHFNSLWPMPGSAIGGLNTWKWEKDGSIEGIASAWVAPLKIKEVLQVEFPKELPTGYQWKDGVPQFRLPKNGEEYWKGSYSPVTAYGDHSKGSYSQFILEKVVATPPVEKYPKYYETGDKTTYAFRKRVNANTYRLVDFSGEEYGYYNWDSPLRDKMVATVELTESEALGRIVAPKTPTPLEKGTKMHEDIIAKTPPNALHGITFGPRGAITTGNTLRISAGPKQSKLSYWITEPAHNSYTAVKKSVRYVVLWGALSCIGYTAYNPAGVARFVKSCLPKITVRYENEKVDG
jgi:hypothetical protein